MVIDQCTSTESSRECNGSAGKVLTRREKERPRNCKIVPRTQTRTRLLQLEYSLLDSASEAMIYDGNARPIRTN